MGSRSERREAEFATERFTELEAFGLPVVIIDVAAGEEIFDAADYEDAKRILASLIEEAGETPVAAQLHFLEGQTHLQVKVAGMTAAEGEAIANDLARRFDSELETLVKPSVMPVQQERVAETGAAASSSIAVIEKAEERLEESARLLEDVAEYLQEYGQEHGQ